MAKFEPGMRVTYTPAARKAWEDAQVFTPLPEGDGTVIATPRPYLTVPGLAYVAWDALPGKFSLTDENALYQVTAQVVAEREKTLAELYMVFKYNWGTEGDDAKFAERLSHDFSALVAAGEDINLRRTDDEWDTLCTRLHLYLGAEERS